MRTEDAQEQQLITKFYVDKCTGPYYEDPGGQLASDGLHIVNLSG